ncbi:hypothetical protein CYLTODRAFT_415426 [Cylindrobasidium torrendii FP15055 ss-10]|uniref:Uncharacterized protein n=1 Tax=Cylindrobasidium torrendii FP15055 ss-10 TaxID=1314674 RepID=A0A0D7ATA8_9AGAR|nr:hypothetical protein CYLTODRAFT_415426 [Cylindrobasidium torrendii FP15055 ss-10]
MVYLGRYPQLVAGGVAVQKGMSARTGYTQLEHTSSCFDANRVGAVDMTKMMQPVQMQQTPSKLHIAEPQPVQPWIQRVPGLLELVASHQRVSRSSSKRNIANKMADDSSSSDLPLCVMQEAATAVTLFLEGRFLRANPTLHWDVFTHQAATACQTGFVDGPVHHNATASGLQLISRVLRLRSAR